ncbi:Alpha/Beta hydrolase protein [Aspergillus pseudonomiae]|nr:Alpha/Beta hydrolase protein [Aspergillus pseudonomiae]
MSLRSRPFTKLPEGTTKSSKMTINIAGFHVYIYGVDELSPQQAEDTVVLFHVHGRTRSYADAELFAHQFLFQLKQMKNLAKGFVVATFDSRNHGERAIDSLATQDWNGGNPKHAQDMLAMIDGNVFDIQAVMKYLKVYTGDRFTPTEFVMSGLSLGGHTAWDILSKVEGIQAAIIIVGSPNLTDLLTERLGDAADSEDGTGLTKWPKSISAMYKARDQSLEQINGKRILILNGALDMLVPNKFTLPWVERNASQNDVSFNVFENTGHWLSFEMMDTIVEWVSQKIA